MKKIFSLALLLISFLLVTLTPAQTLELEKGNGGSLFVTFSADVDSNATVASDPFTIDEFDGASFTTYPINYTKIQSSVSDKPHITATIEGSNDLANWVVIDTVGTPGDSLETLYKGTLTLNDTSYNNKFHYYRVKYVGLDTNRDDATCRTDYVFAKKEER
jgi:hypothetical protein